MPVGKYYCDYCDKEFQDTAAARKRHLQGVQHQRAKALWYNSLSNPQLYNDPNAFGKIGVCNHFVRTGHCQYGDSCKYYHPKQNSQTVNQMGLPPGTNIREGIHSKTLPNSQPFGSASFPGEMFGENAAASLGNLPPSLQPPPEGGYPSLPFVDWG